MVVIGGVPEHIGKLVRRVSNFYIGEKKDDCHWIIGGVIFRDAACGEEMLTDERLELDPKQHLARVLENDADRRKAKQYMKAARDAIPTLNATQTSTQRGLQVQPSQPAQPARPVQCRSSAQPNPPTYDKEREERNRHAQMIIQGLLSLWVKSDSRHKAKRKPNAHFSQEE
ncbi:hypothetical protein V5O48_006470 [Marasmius crinis-equi]|uniref:Uncharacterized protein n=1 Tax=Marasmius crinis-equi TaxID=585013 RepID=A0ABR3FJF3_9AGAR